MSNLAAAIASAKLKKTGASESEVRGSGGHGGGGGMASMMDEMAKTLARRRAQAEGGDSNERKNWDSGSNKPLNGCSPSKDSSDTITIR